MDEMDEVPDISAAALKRDFCEAKDRDTYEETKTAATLAPETADAAVQVLDTVAELSDDEKMNAILDTLDLSLADATNAYNGRYSEKYENINSIRMGIEYGTEDGLSPADIDVRTIFGGAYTSSEEPALFQGFLARLQEKSPEVQSYMLWFIELVNNYTVSINEISLNKNPLKKILFGAKDISGQDWIAGVFEQFKQNEAGMIALSEAIESAEAPFVS